VGGVARADQLVLESCPRPVSIRAGAPPSRLVEILSLGVAKVSEKLTVLALARKDFGMR
jgi:hypothetical protein